MEKTEKDKIEQEVKDVIIDVTKILSQSKRAREDDLWLCIQYWRMCGIRIYINYEDLKTMTTPETITRARRIVQNEMHIFLPENPDVLIRRRVKEEILRNYFKGDQKVITEWENIKQSKTKKPKD
jgi:hypothetical protein